MLVPCPTQAWPPCFETEINGNIYHFNGGGGHADDWHGLPAAEGGGGFEFSRDDVDFACPSANPRCNMTLSGEVMKCQDSTGAWRIGIRMDALDLSPGDFLCNFVTMGGFPWYLKETNSASHCPFEDDCDGFIPYDPGAPAYSTSLGSVDLNAPFGPWIEEEHLHGVVFTSGVGAALDLSNKIFFDCDEQETGCSIDGILTLNNATSLDIY